MNSLLQVHIVRFDAQQKISQIRLYWDQGSLLKQVDVIGARGRAWPIRDGRDQLKLIQKGVAAEPATQTAAAPSSPPQKPRDNGVSEAAEAQNFSPSKKPIKDPHASLSLFSGEPETTQQEIAPNLPKSIAKPPPRDYNELFVGEDADATPTKAPVDRANAPKAGGGHSYKPSRLFSDHGDEGESGIVDKPISSKEPSGYSYQQSRLIGRDIDESGDTKTSQPDTDPVVAPKGGGGHSYKPSRLFGEADDDQDRPVFQANNAKYNHFEFGDGENAPGKKEEPIRPRSSKHNSQWNFEDFATPEKPKTKVHPHDTRHFGWSDDEPEAIAETPPPRPRVAQPRRDAETHFEIQDEPTPMAEKVVNKRTKGTAHNDGLGLYENNLYDDKGNPGAATEDQPPLGIMPNGVSRMKTFGAHWAMSDTSPAPEDKGDENKQPVGLDRQKAVKMMDSSWEATDESPEQPKTTTALPKRASRNVNERSWGFGDDGNF